MHCYTATVPSDVQFVFRVNKTAKDRLFREAELRGVEPSALLRALLDRYLEDIGDEVLGWIQESCTIIQIPHRPEHVQLVVPRRRLTPRSRARP